MKIQIKKHTNVDLPDIIPNGDWIDLFSAVHMEIMKGEHRLIDLGISVKLPKGYELIIAPRSSTFKLYGLIQTNGIGVVDNSYCGDKDHIKMSVYATRDTEITPGARLCQFRVQLSQKATIWQKLKWLFSNNIKIVEVESLKDKSRGGFGSTGA